MTSRRHDTYLRLRRFLCVIKLQVHSCLIFRVSEEGVDFIISMLTERGERSNVRLSKVNVYIKCAKREKKRIPKKNKYRQTQKKNKLQRGIKMQRCLLVAASVQMRDKQDTYRFLRFCLRLCHFFGFGRPKKDGLVSGRVDRFLKLQGDTGLVC